MLETVRRGARRRALATRSPEPPAVIRLEGVTKRYGRTAGIEELDLDVHRGEVLGFLGPNGAGKTTTIRLLLDLIRPTRGRVELFGLDARRHSVALRRRIGYVPGELSLYGHLTGRELISYFARLRRLPSLAPAEALAERLGLDLERRIKALSHGNRQKVALVQALMHDPELLVLDEPSAGLDPLGQQTVAALIREAAAEAGPSSSRRTTSPRWSGSQTASRSSATAGSRSSSPSRRCGGGPPPACASRSRSRLPARRSPHLAGARELGRRHREVTFAVEDEADALVKELARHRVLALESREADLEDVFIELYRGGAGG